MRKSVPLILDDQGDYKYYYILDHCRQLDWSVTQPPVGDLEFSIGYVSIKTKK